MEKRLYSLTKAIYTNLLRRWTADSFNDAMKQYDFMPVWSKDGKSIAFGVDMRKFGVFVIPAEAEAKRITYHFRPTNILMHSQTIGTHIIFSGTYESPF